MNNKNVVFLLMASVFLFSQIFWPHTKVSAAGLVPPPPAYYTCHAGGDGTICQGRTTDEYTGGFDGSCPQGFDILENGFVDVTATRYYNRDGYLVKRVLHQIYPNGDPRNVLYNSQTGTTIAYTSDVTETDTFAVPGDFSTITASFTGALYVITVPGTGLLIQDVGVLVFDPDGNILNIRGPKMLLTGDTEKLCDVLQ